MTRKLRTTITTKKSVDNAVAVPYRPREKSEKIVV
jgi:hypothetical protein